MAGLVSRGLRTICFAKSRKAAELIHRFTAERVDAATARAARSLPRGLHTCAAARDRARLMDGELLGVAATDALELGIDIGAARLCDLGRLSRHGRLAAPAMGARRPPRPRAWRCWSRARTRSTSSSCASPRRCSSGGSRRRASTMPIRAFSTRTSTRRPTKGRSRRPTRRRSARRRSSGRRCCPELERTPAGFVWKGRDTPAARFSLRSGDQDSFTIVEADDRLGARARRARARLLDRARGSRLPPPR